MSFWSRRRDTRITEAVTKALAATPGALPAGVVADQPVGNNPTLASALAAAQTNPVSPQTPAIIEQAMAAQGLDQTDAFSPGRPINPFAGYGVEPRGHDFRVGHNITARPRSGRISFDTLRNIINNYDVARICINHRIDDVRSLDWAVVAGDGVESDVTGAVQAARAAIAKPDGRTPFNGWLAMFLEGILRYDAGALYRRRDMAGRPIGLEVVDGTTVAPELDYFGRRPASPAPAYVQYIEGVPWDWLTENDLIYQPFRPQPDSPYGVAPIEAVLLSANSDIRFQQFFLEYFTEGSMPGGLMEAPADKTDPGQLKEFQEGWDAVMEGDQSQKHKIKWIPAGSKFTATRDYPFDDKFPLFLLHKTCAAYNVTPNDLGFTDDVNRSTGDTQVDIQFRVGTLPLLRHVEGILTSYLCDDLKLPVKFQFDTGQEKDDRETLAKSWQIGVFTGAVGVDEMRAEVYGLPVDNSRPVPRFILDAKTGPMPLRSLFAVAGAIDPSTLAPADDLPLDAGPFVGAEGIMPMKPPGSADFVRAPTDPDDPGYPGSGVVVPGTEIVTPAVESAANAAAAGVTPVAKAGPVAAGLAVKAADTGRVLLIQRSNADPADPARGCWEFPGGCLEEGEEPQVAAMREWQEETGCVLPAYESLGGWVSPDGVYMGYVAQIPAEADLPINLSPDNRQALNPDDPDGDDIEIAAWWDPKTLPGMPALRSEAQTTDWDLLIGTGSVVKSATPEQLSEAAELRRWRDNARGRVRKGQTPRRFSSDVLSAATTDRVWELLADAATREQVDHAFTVVAKASLPKVPQYHSEPTAQHRALIEDRVSTWAAGHVLDALAELHPGLKADLEALYASLSSRVVKAVAPLTPEQSAALEAALAKYRGQPAPALDAAVRAIYGNAWQAATGITTNGLAAQGVSVAAGADLTVTDVDWDTWTPGWDAAASQASDGGLADLLARAEQTIMGMSDSQIDRIGSAVADGLADGSAWPDVASAIDDVVGDPDRAATIAVTETSRAAQAATMASYSDGGIGEWNWLTAVGACDECVGNEDGSPYPVGGGPTLPAHPRCRCTSIPVIEGYNAPPAAESEPTAEEST